MTTILEDMSSIKALADEIVDLEAKRWPDKPDLPEDYEREVEAANIKRESEQP